MDVALHALDWFESNYEPVDGLILLQPTSPFRTQRSIVSGMELFFKNRDYPVISISSSKHHPMWTLKINGDFLEPFLEDSQFNMRSQDLPPLFVPNGLLYIIDPSYLRSHRSFYGPQAIPLLIDSSIEALDIDTEYDFSIAQSFSHLLKA